MIFRRNLFFSAFTLLLLAAGCNSNDSSTSDSGRLLPQASLVPHELLVVMDETQWDGLLGQAVRDIYSRPMPGLPQEEPWFVLRHIKPEDLKGFLKRYPNMLFVFTMDNTSRSSKLLQSMFSDEALAKIKEDRTRHRITRTNEYARGQEVMYLFGANEAELIGRLYNQQDELLSYFEKIERDRYIKEFRQVKVSRPLQKQLRDEYGFSMVIPAGYEIAKQDSNFVWIRLLDNKVDKSFWVSWQPYASKSQFQPDSVLAYRNRVAKNYIWGSDASTYMRLEDQVKPISQEVTFNGGYALSFRGLWRLEKMVMGGPFVGLAFVDEATQRFYYLEGFTYAPGQDKREAISELEAVLWSFKSYGTGADSGKSTQ